MMAAEIAHALNGKRNGQRWLVRCPSHDDKEPSLSICDGEGGRLLVRCFANCDPVDVLAKLRHLGLSKPHAPHSSHVHREQTAAEAADIARRVGFARDIWNDSVEAQETPVERYLQARGYTGPIPATLRYHRALWHRPTGQSYPAMVSAITVVPGRHVEAIHRTWLKADGSGKAGIEGNKTILAPCKGGAVRLAPVGHKLAISEGIETGLSVQLATGISTWAAGSASNIASLILPALPLAADVLITADHDANSVGQRAAETAARRWTAEGRQVRIAMPPEVGTDFNDLLMNGGAI